MQVVCIVTYAEGNYMEPLLVDRESNFIYVQNQINPICA